MAEDDKMIERERESGGGGQGDCRFTHLLFDLSLYSPPVDF